MIRPYTDLEVTVLNSTFRPGSICRKAMDIPMKKDVNFQSYTKTASPASVKYLVEAGHTSLLEMADITFGIKFVSRNLVMQLTRHRQSSFIVSSQHYLDYRDFDDIVSPSVIGNQGVIESIKMANQRYCEVVDSGIKPEEARQLLPGSKACTLIWKVNARSLMNFLNLRLCKRNTEEMYNFADRIHEHTLCWWKDLFELAGPDCKNGGKCTQGAMRCSDAK